MSTEPGNSAHRSPLPSGVVTFVFTDIEGSSTRWERAPVAMAEAVRRHDDIVRAAIESHGGHVFKTIGDAFCAAFSRAGDAAEAAIAAQKALGLADFTAVDGIRVRIGIHTGEADERDADYFGPAVNRVARLQATAHGGQTIVSSTTARLLEEQGWDASRLRDLGYHRLKDLSSRERISQILDASLPSDFPPLRSLGVLANNLPANVTSFAGRDIEVAELRRLISAHRVVTITGSGGIGKTRAALQVGAASLESAGRGVWFVELASLDPGGSVALAVASAANIRADLDGPDDGRAFYAELDAKSELLILDNCEHVLDDVSGFIQTVRDRCRHLSVLCTSRERLAVAGEFSYRMPSLAFPLDPLEPGVSEALSYAAVELFVDRARAVNSRFAASDESIGAVVQICRRLDGIPLAIELAAARSETLTPRALLDRLHDRFRLLRSADRAALPRQQTLRAMIDWSYDLLDGAEKTVFARLSVFRGGFTLEAAEAVAGHGVVERDDVFETLTRLVEKSLVIVDFETPDIARFRLTETILEYAKEKLQSETAHAIVLERFATWANDVVRFAHESWISQPGDAWDATYRIEIENLRSAIAWTLEHENDRALGVSIVANARRIWGRLAPSEGARYVALAKSRLPADAPDADRAELAVAEAHVRVALREYDRAVAAAREAIALLGDVEERNATLMDARRFAGFASVHVGDLDGGLALLRNVVAVASRGGSHQESAYALQDLAVALLTANDAPAAKDAFRDALHHFAIARNDRGIFATTVNLAELEFFCGNPSQAIRILRDAVPDASGSTSRCHIAVNFASYHIALDEWASAVRYVSEALDVASPEDRIPILVALQHAAVIALVRDDRKADDGTTTAAAALLAFVDAELQASNVRREQNEEREIARARSALAERRSREERASPSRGDSWDVQRAILEARRILKTLPE